MLTLLVPLVASVVFAVGQATGGGQAQPQPSGTLPDFSSWPVVVGMGFFDAWNNAMTLFYVASFALLFLRPRWQPRLLRFAPVGRMALSVYVGQTLVGVLVFFGFGLGLLGRFGNSVTLPMGLALFALQVWASRASARSLPPRAARVGVAVADLAAARAPPPPGRRARRRTSPLSR